MASAVAGNVCPLQPTITCAVSATGTRLDRALEGEALTWCEIPVSVPALAGQPAVDPLPAAGIDLRIVDPESALGSDGLQEADRLGGLEPSSSRGESHPPALTEPCLTVSRYTALLI